MRSSSGGTNVLELLPARPVVQPTWWACPEYAYTVGDLVCEVAASAGFAPDPEQELILNGMFGKLADGRPAAFEVDIFGPRQNIKTGTIVQAILGWLFVDDIDRIIYTAQDLKASEECWELVASLIESTPSLSKRLASGRGDRPGITEGRGNWAIDLKSGQRSTFVTRGKNTGRALRARRVVLDEGFAVTGTHMGGLLPVLSAMWGAQFVHASSAGKIDSHVSKDARDRGREGGSFRQLYVEYGDVLAGKGCQLGERCDHARTAPGCALDDEDRWRRIMPALGGRVDIDTIRGLRLVLPPAEFARECMVWWDVEGSARKPPTIDGDVWSTRANESVNEPEAAVLMIDVAPDMESATVAVAGEGSGDKTLVMVKRKAGTAWVVPYLRDTFGLGDQADGDEDDADQPEREILEVVLNPKSKASVLLKALDEAGIDYYEIDAATEGQACAAWQDAITNDEIEHVNQKDLNDAVGNAFVRWSGEADRWDRRDRSIDIGPVVAGSGALWRWQIVGSSGFGVY